MLTCGHKSHTGSFSLDKCYAAQGELERKAAAYDAALACVNKQAENSGLWFVARTGAEAYLQQELARLHAVIEQDAERAASHEAVSKTQSAVEGKEP